jgi:hypothetical protein
MAESLPKDRFQHKMESPKLHGGIARIIRNRGGKAGAWEVQNTAMPGEFGLWHYNTLMLTWNYKGLGWYSLGHGSVSDQNGMNIAFKILGFPNYYSRKGGARILWLENEQDRKRLPKYLRTA